VAAHDGGEGFTTTGEGHVVQFGDVCSRCFGDKASEDVIGATGRTAAKGNRPRISLQLGHEIGRGLEF
jgi:hypothetical protein